MEEKKIKKGAYTIVVCDKSCELKKIDRYTLEMALGFIMQQNQAPQYIKAGEVILQNCWLSGDEEIRTDDEYLVPAAMQCFQLIEFKDASLKKN